MGVYINGMEMPKSCLFCELYEADLYWCRGAKRDVIDSETVADFCPLVHVPPHGDLIDRDPFIEFIKTHWDSYDQWFVEQLEARPTIIPGEEGET